MRLKDFLLKLIDDPKKLADFKRNPDSAIKSAKLSPKEMAALKSGNPRRISNIVVAQAGPRPLPPLVMMWPKPPMPSPNGGKGDKPKSPKPGVPKPDKPKQNGNKPTKKHA